MPAQATIIRGADQPNVWLLSDYMKPLLGRDHTDGHLAISLYRVHPNGGTPPHVHRREDEGFYLLEGELTFLYNDTLLKASPGMFIWGPRDVIHSFKCTSATPAKAVLMVSPTNFTDFAAQLSKPAGDFEQPPTVTPEEMAKLMSLAPQYGIEMLPDHPLPALVGTAAGASKHKWVMGEHVSYLATSAQTSGRFTIVEIRTSPAGGPPPHVHLREDEVFYVVDGQHEVVFDDRTEIAGPGDLAYIPRHTRHRYSNVGQTPGKLLSIHTPGGFEAFFDECGVDAADHPTAPAFAPPPPDALAELLARYGMTM